MLVTFKSRAFADVTMFGEVAHRLLKMMGLSGQVPGAILSADVPAALAMLRSTLDRVEPETPAADEDEEQQVPLHNRAKPLLDLLEAAAAEGADVMWEH